jgi:hypothetical protein
MMFFFCCRIVVPLRQYTKGGQWCEVTLLDLNYKLFFLERLITSGFFAFRVCKLNILVFV